MLRASIPEFLTRMPMDPEVSANRVGKVDIQAEEENQKGWLTDDQIASFKSIPFHHDDYSSLKKAFQRDLMMRMTILPNLG